MRVVVDTNVLVVARFKEGGTERKLLEDCIGKVHLALYTPPIEEEANRVLTKTGASAAFLGKVYRFFSSAELVQEVIDLKICADPSDDMFLECAVSGKANYLISEDGHLRELDGYRNIRICTATEFYQENDFPKKT